MIADTVSNPFSTPFSTVTTEEELRYQSFGGHSGMLDDVMLKKNQKIQKLKIRLGVLSRIAMRGFYDKNNVPEMLESKEDQILSIALENLRRMANEGLTLKFRDPVALSLHRLSGGIYRIKPNTEEAVKFSQSGEVDKFTLSHDKKTEKGSLFLAKFVNSPKEITMRVTETMTELLGRMAEVAYYKYCDSHPNMPWNNFLEDYLKTTINIIDTNNVNVILSNEYVKLCYLARIERREKKGKEKVDVSILKSERVPTHVDNAAYVGFKFFILSGMIDVYLKEKEIPSPLKEFCIGVTKNGRLVIHPKLSPETIVKDNDKATYFMIRLLSKRHSIKDLERNKNLFEIRYANKEGEISNANYGNQVILKFVELLNYAAEIALSKVVELIPNYTGSTEQLDQMLINLKEIDLESISREQVEVLREKRLEREKQIINESDNTTPLNEDKFLTPSSDVEYTTPNQTESQKKEEEEKGSNCVIA